MNESELEHLTLSYQDCTSYGLSNRALISFEFTVNLRVTEQRMLSLLRFLNEHRQLIHLESGPNPGKKQHALRLKHRGAQNDGQRGNESRDPTVYNCAVTDSVSAQ